GGGPGRGGHRPRAVGPRPALRPGGTGPPEDPRRSVCHSTGACSSASSRKTVSFSWSTCRRTTSVRASAAGSAGGAGERDVNTVERGRDVAVLGEHGVDLAPIGCLG